MAEKVIIDLEIDNNDAIASTKLLTAAVVDQTDAIKKTNDETKELEKRNKDLVKANKEINDQVKKGTLDRAEGTKQLESNNRVIDKNTSKIKQNKIDIIGQKDALTKTKAERKSAVKTMEAEANSLDSLRAKNKSLKTEQGKLNLKTKEGKKRFKEINKELDNNNKVLGKSKAAFQGLPGPIGAVQAAFNKMLANPIFAVLAVLVLTLKGLFEAFTRSSKGQDALAKGMGFLKGLLAVVQRGFDALAKVVISVFEDPQQAVKDLWQVIKTNLVNRVEGVSLLFSALGRAAKAAFSFDVDEAKEALEDVAFALVQVSTGISELQIEKGLKAIKKVGEEIAETTRKSIDLQQAQLNLRRANLNAIVKIAGLEVEINKARADASNKLIPVEERLKAIAAAEELTRQKQSLQIDLAKQKLNLKKIENSLANSGLEDLEEEANLQAAVLRLEGERVTALKTFTKLKATVLDELADKEIKQIQSIAKAEDKSKKQSLESLIQGFTELLETAELTARKRVDIQKQLDTAISTLAKAALKVVEKNAELELGIRRETVLKALEGSEFFFRKSQEFIDENFETTRAKLEKDLASERITKEEHALGLLQAQNEFNEATSELNQEFRESEDEIDQQDFEARRDLEDQRFQEDKEILQSQFDAELLTEQEHKAALEKLEQDHTDIILKINKDKQDKLFKNLESAIGATQAITSAAFSIAASNLEAEQRKESDAFNSQNQKLLSNLQARLDSGLISQEDFDKEKATLDNKAIELQKKQAKEQHALDVKAFNTKKALDLVEIGIQIAKTISAAIAASPLTFGLPWTALNLAVQTAQGIAIAASNPPPAPSFAEGGMVIKGKSHAQGGENIHVGGKLIGNMQGDEGLFVTKKEATMDALSHINESYGGRSFKGRVHNSFFQEGGTGVPISQGIDREELIAILNELPPPVVKVVDVQAGLVSREETLEVTVI